MLRRYIGRARRLTAELVTACLLLTLLPASALAEGDAATAAPAAEPDAIYELSADALPALPEAAEVVTEGVISESQTWTGSITGAVTIAGGTAESPVVITVSGTVTAGAPITVSSGYVKFTGGTIQWNANLQNALIVESGASAELEGVTLDGSGVIFDRSALLIIGTATLGAGATVRNFTSTGERGAGAGYKGVIAAYGGTLNVQDGAVITGNQCGSGIIALYDKDEGGNTSDAKVVMTGGTISGNTVGSSTMGVIWNWTGTLEISGGSVTAEGSEYAVYTQGNAGTFGRYGAATAIRGGAFRGGATGAVCAGKTSGCDSKTQLYGGAFSGKSAAAVRDGTIEVYGGTFSGTSYALDLGVGSISVSGGAFFGGTTAYRGGVTTLTHEVIVGEDSASARDWDRSAPLNTYHFVAIGSVYTDPHSYSYSSTGDAVVTGTCSCGRTGTATLTVAEGADLTYTGGAIVPAEVVYSKDWVGSRDAEIIYTDNINVGTATAEISIRGAAASVHFPISKAAPTVPPPPTPSPVDYDSSRSLSDVPLPTGWAWADGGVVPTVDNGGYSAHYSIEDDVNYDWSGVEGYNGANRRLERTVALTVLPGVVAPPAVDSKAYTGVELTADVPESTLYTVTENGGGVDAGAYDVVLALKDSRNYRWERGAGDPLKVSFYITQAANEWTVQPALSGWTFGETPGSPAGRAKFGAVEVEYKLKAEADAAYSATRPTDVGDYTARFSVAESGNYTPLSQTVDFTVSPAGIGGISAEHYSGVYDGKPHGITVAAPEGAAVEYSLSDGSGWSLSQPEIKDVTDGTTVYYRVSMANYNTVTGSATVTIKPKEVVLSWTGNCAHTYTGRIPGVTAAVVGTVSGDSCAVTGYTGNTEKDVGGPYAVTANGLTNPNYKLSDSPGTTYSVTPAPLSVSVADGLAIGKVYDGTTNVESGDTAGGLVVKGLQNGETAAASGTWTYDTAHAGTGKAVSVIGISIAYGTADPGNYSFEAAPLAATGEITRKEITPVIDLSPAPPYAYTGAQIAPAYTVKDGGMPLTAGDYEGVFSDNVDAGTARLTVTAGEAGNYSFAPAEKTFTIHPRPLAAAWENRDSWVYDGLPHAPAATAETGVAGEIVKLAVSGAESDAGTGYTAAAGIAFVTGGRAKAENYTLTNAAKDFAIAQRPAVLTWSGWDHLVYTGSPVNVTAAVTNLADGDECAVTVAGGGRTDAGTGYTATATALSNPNYKLEGGAAQEYTIAKAPVTFTVTDNIHGYDGRAHTAAVAQTAAEATRIPAGGFTVTYGGAASRTDVGVYAVEAEITDGNFQHAGSGDAKVTVGELSIRKTPYPEQEKMTWPSAEDVTYGAALSESALPGGGTESIGGPGSFAWTDAAIIPTVANAGYSVTFTPADTNYDPLTSTVMISVSPKELTVAGAAAAARQYVPGERGVAVSGGDLAGVVVRNGAPDDVVLDGSKAVGTVATPDAAPGKPVTVTGYALAGGDAGNYTLRQPEDVTVDIAKSTAGSGSVAMEGWTYDGTARKVPVPASGTNGTQHVTYRYTGAKLDESAYDSADAPTDAGTYTVAATFAATENYEAVTVGSAEFTVAPKPIMAQWKETSQLYDGAAKSPALTTVGAEEADQSDVYAQLTGGGKTDAGSYAVTAALAGGRAFNYTLTNPSGALLIQKAPVVFTVTDSILAFDGTAKAAAVTADPDAPHTVFYRSAAGENVAAPTAAGSYEIWAAITDSNYRHADSTGGGSRKIGVLTIYQITPPAKYAVSFAPGEALAVTGGTAPLDEAPAGTLRVLPACGFARTGWSFTGWELDGRLYQPSQTVEQPARSLTFTARWAETRTIGGTLTQENRAVPNAVVTLMRGARYIADTVTDGAGKFRFTGVAPGLYNLVGSRNGVVMTIKAEVTAADMEDAVIELPKDKTNSVVEVLAGTPEVIVGNLERAFREENTLVYTEEDRAVVERGGAVELKLTARALEADGSDEGQAALQERVQNVGLYLDLTLQKTVMPMGEPGATTSLSTSGEALLESIIPLPADLQDKHYYTVCRLHDPDGGGPEQPALDTLTENPNEAGEFIEVSGDKTALTIHARDYSLYAIAWEDQPFSAVYPPAVEMTEHGTTEVRPRRPVKGEQVVITPIPDGGYAAGAVAVTDRNGNVLPLTDNGDGTWSYVQPSGGVTIAVEFVPISSAWNPFIDVGDRDWFYGSVKYVYERGLMNGTAADRFSPHWDTTRGMIVTILWRLEREPDSGAEMTFMDVAEDSYCFEAIRWGQEHRIVKGYTAAAFGPGNPITRQELSAILYRYARYKGRGVSASGDLAAFTDRPDPWAAEAVGWAVGEGLLTGKGGGVLDPRGQATRAEAAAVLQRFLTGSK